MHQITEEVLSLLLRQAFSASLDEFPNPLAVWQTVNQCLKDICNLADITHVTDMGASTLSSSGTARDTGPDNSNEGSRKRARNGSDGVGEENGDEDECDGDEEGVDEDEGGGDEADEDEDSDSHQRSKKTSRHGKHEPQDLGPKLGCPFRKRNPARFNLRDHQVCAYGAFTNLSTLK